MSVKELRLDASNDKVLVSASVDGDRGAYAELVRRHSRHVFAVCLGVLGTFEDAEDMAQEAFVKGFGQLGQLRDGNQFGAWIVRVARNLSVDFVRREIRGRELLAENSPEGAVHGDRHLDLHDAVARLPERYRFPLVLYYFDGRSSESVARTLDITPAGVLTRLSRARKELRRMLSSRETADD
jgi:RNA polymerase sigma-70 factor (ECF subfamily)